MRHTLLIASLALLSSGSSASAQDQSGVALVSAPNRVVAPVPFGPGERAEYKVTLGFLGKVGEGSMEVTGIDTLRGHPTYHLRMRLEGGIPFARVNDDFQSWLDVSTLVSRRFHQDVHEVRYKRKRTFDFFPEERRWERVDNDDRGTLPTNEPLDDISFLYFVRTLPLEVGKTYTFNRYFKDDGNPVTVRVLRRDTVSVPAGIFSTIVVQPIIQTDGLFGEGGKAEVHFTDDDRRILVQLTSSVPILKSLNLYLESYVPGRKLTASDFASR